MVRIELFGVPQLKAQRNAVEVDAQTLGGAMRALGATCPALLGTVVRNGTLGEEYVIALNGRNVTLDPNTVLNEGDVLVLLSAQAGG